MKARGQPAAAPDFVISDDAEPTAPMRAGEANDRDLERLEAAFTGCSVRKQPRGCPVPPLYLPCRGSLPSMQQAVVTAAKRWSMTFALRARWNPKHWRLHLQRGHATGMYAGPLPSR